MDRQELIFELKEILGNYLKYKEIDLIDLIYRYEGRDLILRILVDKPQGGISLDDCVHLNSEISSILDKKDIIKGKYILEVSSPGIDRPLRIKSDFSRCINKSVRVFLKEPIKGKKELEGKIKEVKNDSIYIEIENEIIEISLSKIDRAKQMIV